MMIFLPTTMWVIKTIALLIVLTRIQENTFNVNKWLKELEVQIDVWDCLLQYFSKCGLQLSCNGYLLKFRYQGPYPLSFESESLGLESKNEVSRNTADDSNIHKWAPNFEICKQSHQVRFLISILDTFSFLKNIHPFDPLRLLHLISF